MQRQLARFRFPEPPHGAVCLICGLPGIPTVARRETIREGGIRSGGYRDSSQAVRIQPGCLGEKVTRLPVLALELAAALGVVSFDRALQRDPSLPGGEVCPGLGALGKQ
jgi:hypothetical protein